MLDGLHRLLRLVLGSASPVPPPTEARQHLDHVLIEIVLPLLLVNDENLPARRLQGRFDVLRAETGKPVPMLHDDRPDRRISQQTDKLLPTLRSSYAEENCQSSERQSELAHQRLEVGVSLVTDRRFGSSHLLGHNSSVPLERHLSASHRVWLPDPWARVKAIHLSYSPYAFGNLAPVVLGSIPALTEPPLILPLEPWKFRAQEREELLCRRGHQKQHTGEKPLGPNLFPRCRHRLQISLAIGNPG